MRVRTRLSAPFGPPALIDGENSAEYEELLVRVSATVKPADILEEIWVRDVVDLVWEARRLRRLKAALMTANAHKGLNTALLEIHELARRIAEAQINLRRVRSARHDLLSSALADSEVRASSERPLTLATIVSDLAPRLSAMDRYERRALSRRKFAIRAFDARRGEERLRVINRLERPQLGALREPPVGHCAPRAGPIHSPAKPQPMDSEEIPVHQRRVET